MEGEGHTYACKHPFVYKWYVNNITSYINCASDGEIIIESPEFSAGARIKDLWCLRLEITPKSDYSPKKLKIFLWSKNGDRKIQTKYGIYLLNNKTEKISPSWDDFGIQYLNPINKIITSSSSNLTPFINADKLLEKSDEFFRNDALIIGVDLTVYDNHVSLNIPTSLVRCRRPLMSDDFKDLLVSKKKSDIVIKVEDKIFDAHKFLLTARSSVFDAMFSHNMEENKKNEVIIPDIDPEVFEKLLEYIYTDKIEELNGFAEGLLEASDKYQLRGLKETCEIYLVRNFTIENAVRVMVLADRHSAMELKEAAITYILVHFSEIQNTADYKEFKESQSSLVFEFFQKYVERINTN